MDAGVVTGGLIFRNHQTSLNHAFGCEIPHFDAPPTTKLQRFHIRTFPLSHSFRLENCLRIERIPRTALVNGGCAASLCYHTPAVALLFASFASALLCLYTYLGIFLLEVAEYPHLNNSMVSLPQ